MECYQYHCNTSSNVIFLKPLQRFITNYDILSGCNKMGATRWVQQDGCNKPMDIFNTKIVGN